MKRLPGLIAALLAAGTAAAWLSSTAAFHSGPTWKGRTMGDWIDFVTVDPPPHLCSVDSVLVGSLTVGEAREAARELGSDAVPAIVAVLRERDSTLRERAYEAWTRLPPPARSLIPAPRPRALQRTVVALDCLEEISVHAGPACRDLVDRMDSEPILEEWILRILGSMGSNASPAVPHLGAKLAGTADAARLAAFSQALWRIGPASRGVFKQVAGNPNSAVALAGAVGGLWIDRDTNGVVRLLESNLFGPGPRPDGTWVSPDRATHTEVPYPVARCAEALASALGADLESMRPILLERLGPGELPVARERAAGVLGALGPGDERQTTVARLLLSATHETDPGALRAELRAIGAMGVRSAEVARALDSFLHGADEETIEVAREVAAQLGLGSGRGP